MYRRALSVFLITFLAAHLSLAKKGGSDGAGGGDIHLANADDVKAAVDELYLYKLQNAVAEIRKHRSKITNRILVDVFNKWYGPPGSKVDDGAPVYDAIKKSRYHFVDGDEECPVDGKSHAASVDAFVIGSDVCYSLKTFTSFPREKLDEQIISIAIHELVHQFGYKLETEPNAVQNFVMGKGYSYVFDAGLWNSLQFLAGLLANSVLRGEPFLTEKGISEDQNVSAKDTEKFCFIMGQISSSFDSIQMLIYSHSYYSFTEEETWANFANDLYSSSKTAVSVCDEGNDFTYKKLKDTITPLLKDSKELYDSIVMDQ